MEYVTATEPATAGSTDEGVGLRTAAAGLPATLRDELALAFGERFSQVPVVREQHGRGESPFPAMPPDAVIFAESADDVARVLARCNDHEVPVIAFGAGSSLEGQVLATRGGVCVDLSRMNAILDVSPDDFTATVEPGVTKEALNAALRPHGLFFSVDPGAHATIGGMAATRASGTNTVRYGSMRENVLACTTVLADGRVVCAGSRTMKSAAGLDLARLFVGSEGTLGIITELTVKLHPLPEAVSAAIVSFPDAAGAVTTVIQGVQVGLPLARAEYLCPNTIRVVNATNPGLSLQERHTLFLEFHGSSQVGLDEQAGLMGRIAAENGGGDFAWASHPEDRTRLWHARHNAYFSCQRSRPGSIILTTDTCVPRSRLAESLAGAMRIMADAVFPHMIFGHVGDGNFHVLMAIDPSSESEHSEAETLNTAIVDLALSLGGTCSGEHGIGFHKKAFLRREAGEDATEVMRQIKSLLDPRNIMNPDKIF